MTIDYRKTQPNPLSPKVQAERRKQILASTPAEHRYKNITGKNYKWTGTVEEDSGKKEFIVGGQTVTPEVYNATQQELTRISQTQQSPELKNQQQKATIQAIAGGFSGRVEQSETDTGRIAREEFFLRGRQTAQIDYPRGRDPYVTTTTPSRFFEERTTPSGIERRETTFAPSGAQVLESMELNMPSVTEENYLGERQTGTQQQETKRNIFTDVGNLFGSRVSSIKERITTSKDPVVVGYRNIFNIFTDVGNLFGSRVSSIKERITTSKDPVVVGYRNIFNMGREIVTPTYTTLKGGGKIVAQEIVIPTIESSRMMLREGGKIVAQDIESSRMMLRERGKIVAQEIVIPTIEISRMMLRDIAEPSKIHLEQVYGKPEDISVTRWISTVVPKKLGEGTANFFTKTGMKESKVDISMLKDIVQPVITTAGYSIDITKDVYRYNRNEKIKSTVIPSLPSTVNVSPQVYGKGVEYTTRVGQYFVPYYGSSLIFGSATESILGGPLGGERTVTSYVKAHPVEATFVGAYGGIKAYPFVSGYIRTAGRTEIPVNIVPEKVLSGKQTFWSEGEGSIKEIAKTHLSLFKSRQYGTPIVTRLEGYTGTGKLVPTSSYSRLPVDVPITPYHATGSIFWKDGKFVVGESPLHVAPALSANFLRISNQGRSDGLWNSLTSPFMRSGALITLTSGKNIIIRKGYEATRGTYLWKGKTPSAGKLVIPAGGKTEVQALFLTGTEGQVVSQQYYGVWKGVRYPIDIFKIGSEGATPSTKAITGLTEGSVLSYSGLPSTSASVYRGFGISFLYPSKRMESSISKTTIPSSSIRGTTSTSYIKSSSITPSYSSVVKSSRRGRASSSLVSSSTPISSSIISSSITPSISSIVTIPSKTKIPYVPRPTGSSYRMPPPPSRPPTIPRGFFLPSISSGRKQKGFGKIPVFLRRFGKFKVIGFGRTEREAFTIGKEAASRTLGATFKVPTAKKQPLSIKGFKTKQTKEGTLFIELPKFRLSKAQEKAEIKMFRQMKGGKRR